MDLHEILLAAEIATKKAGASENPLRPTGNMKDRTAEIRAELATGYCKLGKGKFYVKNLVMPANSTLEGCGDGTVLILDSSVTDGFAVKMGSHSSVRNLRIFGSDSAAPAWKPSFTVNETVGSRHGILWEGSEDGAYSEIKYYGKIDNVLIAYFNGGGITCRNSSTRPPAQLCADNIQISACDCGIYIPQSSEYNTFTNVTANFCYYGSINNGGNNMFTNCHFTRNTMALLVDNTNPDKANNGHGSYVNCSFNHNNDNNGTAIRMINVDYGMVFTGCQIWFGDIQIVNCNGIVFNGLLSKGDGKIINVMDKAAYFNNSIFETAPDVWNTEYTIFNNCYLFDGSSYSG